MCWQQEEVSEELLTFHQVMNKMQEMEEEVQDDHKSTDNTEHWPRALIQRVGQGRPVFCIRAAKGIDDDRGECCWSESKMCKLEHQ